MIEEWGHLPLTTTVLTELRSQLYVWELAWSRPKDIVLILGGGRCGDVEMWLSLYLTLEGSSLNA